MKKTIKKVKEKDFEVKEKDLKQKESEKDLQEKVFTDVKKLKCDYAIYKRERRNYKMPIIEKCQKCNKKFNENDELYIAYAVNNDIKESCIICSKCAKEFE